MRRALATQFPVYLRSARPLRDSDRPSIQPIGLDYDLHMTSEGQVHEQAIVRAFIRKDKQERSLFLLSNPERRRKFTDGLAHFKWLDMRFAHRIPASTAHTAGELISLLRRKGAGQMVWVVSEYAPIDGRETSLEEAMEQTWGLCMGTILSCVPGKLAFFRGEDMRSEYLLERP